MQGLRLRTDRPSLMGIINVTPDSFSDGGWFFDPVRAVDHGLQLIEDGADILDIGGESTRPGAIPVPVEEEIRRVVPVIRNLSLQARHIPLSVDTRNAPTMAAALEAGATLINDISALTHDKDSLLVAARSEAAVVLMHTQGTPEIMQASPQYTDVTENVYQFLKGRMDICLQSGIQKERLIVDPGIGFGKTLEHNLQLFRDLDRFHTLGVPVLLGASRKSFIAKICGDIPTDLRLPGSLTAALWAVQKGIQILRVHDVAETKQAIKVLKAICQGHSVT